MQTATFQVVGRNTMHCAGCESSVKFALKMTPGVQSVDADYKTQRIRLEYDPAAVSTNKVVQALDGIGYEVEEVTQ